MALLPGIYTDAVMDRLYLVNHHPLVRAEDVVLDHSVRGLTPPEYRIPAGTVIVRRVQGANWVDAEHPAADRGEPASVVSLVAPDAAWANTVLTVSYTQGLGFPVLLDAAATTTAAVVDQLNLNPGFAGSFIADDLNGLVRIRSRGPGAHVRILVESSLPAAFGPNGTVACGRTADFRVTDKLVEVRDLVGNPIDVIVPTLWVGHFHTAQLLHLTAEARAVLEARGSRFRN